MKTRPIFPTYFGPPLPNVLQPWKLKHCGLLLRWTFFQPSRLRYYLYQADSDLYRKVGLKISARTLLIPAYRQMYLTSMIISVFVAIFLTSSVAWTTATIQATSLDWQRLAIGLVLFGVFGAAFVGVILLAAITLLGLEGLLSEIVGISPPTFALAIVSSMLAGSFAVSVTLGIAVSTASSTAILVAASFMIGLAIVTGGGLVGNPAGGSLAVITLGLLAILIGSFTGYILIGVSLILGGIRILFFLVELPLTWYYTRFANNCPQLEYFPAFWDELVIWPFPHTSHLLQRCLENDLDFGIRFALQLAANPCQRWNVQRALSDFISEHSNPLKILYYLANSPMLDVYPKLPIRQVHWDYPSVRLVILGEIGQKFIAATPGTGRGSSDYLIWHLTKHLRRMNPTPISQFSAMLYFLFLQEKSQESSDLVDIALSERFTDVYEDIRHLLHGLEVANSFAAIDVLFQCDTTHQIALIGEQLAWLDNLKGPPLRPAVVESFKALSDIIVDVREFSSPATTSRTQMSASLNRAAGGLNELAGYIEKKVPSPEKTLLAKVVQKWQSVIAEEQGRLGQLALLSMSPSRRQAIAQTERRSNVWQRPARPFDNPYVAGDPVYPPLFVGRRDVFNRIGEVWSAKSNPDSIILYGHRRMGKSSILRNLDQVARSGSLVVYVDMAGETSFVKSTADLLLNLADRIFAEMRRQFPAAALAEPKADIYSNAAQAQREFNRFSEQVRDALNGQNLILALDEFEAVERAVKQDKIQKDIYQFLRTKTQEPWLTLVFGGLHTLDEMSRDYQQPFYGSYENIRVSYLSKNAAWQLITNPTEEFTVNYKPDAVERIIAVTGGQPYLVQQVCRDVLDHLNHELFDLSLEREIRINLADVEAVLNEDCFQRGRVYFDGVWTQAYQREQELLLSVIAQRNTEWSFNELALATNLALDVLQLQLRWAEHHDILEKINGDEPRWRFYVPLMHEWIRRKG